MSEEVVDALLAYTQRHPFYVNALARALWDRRNPPTVSSIKGAWTEFMTSES